MSETNERAPIMRRTSDARRLIVAVGLLLALTGAPLGADATVTSARSTAEPTVHIRKADAALAAATTHVAAKHPRRAIRALDRLRVNLRRAHGSAQGLIGQPPTDPESDDPPGPPAVLAVLRLDHRASTRLVPPFDGLTHRKATGALTRTLTVIYRRRDAILAEVIALPAEGAGDDYTDGMSDTLAQYSSEVDLLSAATTNYQLTALAARRLSGFLATVVATQAVVEATYGGGE